MKALSYARQKMEVHSFVADARRHAGHAATAKFLLAGLELLHAARRDSRDRLLKQLGQHDGAPLARDNGRLLHRP
jgi:hypothetical protein